MIQVLLILIAFLATLIGATTGIGGGIVIKVLYDVIGLHSILEIGFYTTVVVFTMSIISIYKQYRSGFNYDLNILLSISLGSVLGGYLGDWLLNLFAGDIPKTQLQIGQSVILLLTLIFLLYYTHRKGGSSIELTRTRLNMFLLGLFLGSISIFLGIGGGPLNVSLLVIFFNYPMKQASVYSIATVFFSQITKIVSIIGSQQYLQFDLGLVPWLIFVGVVGGYYGTRINQRITNEAIGKVYDIFMLGMCALTIFNIVRFI
jgi:hypothetical protein